MKRFLIALLIVFAGAFCWGAAYATCADGYFEYGVDCIESKFQITTTEMDADTTFSFYISATGTFYVDWGDGAVQEIVRSNTTETLYSHTYASGGVYHIQFGGLATGYSTVSNLNQPSVVPDMAAIRFFTGTLNRWAIDESGSEMNIANISGTISAIFPTIGNGGTLATQPRFYFAFANAQNLTGPLYASLFTGLRGNAVAGMWYYTFSNCINLNGVIPEALFANISGIERYLFTSTFSGCRNLSGTVPKDLFKNISGTAIYAFASTFRGCRNLSGIVPKDLFKNIVGDGKNYMFYRCFESCSDLTGYISSELFAGVVGDATGMVAGTFSGTQLYTTCPCGTSSTTTGWGATTVDGRAVCAVGKKSNEHWNNGVCTTDCELGVTKMKTSTGLEYTLLSDSTTDHGIYVGYNDGVCNVPLANGGANNAINVSFDGNTYHATLPDEIVPTGFTGQPSAE